MTLRAAIYARVSTVRQAAAELSLPDQIAQCERYCRQQSWDVVETYVEPGASARDDARPVFQEMVFAAKRQDHPFDVIVVHSLSRFSRSVVDAGLHTRELERAGVKVVSITQAFGDGDAAEFIRNIFHAFDEHQSRENAKHVHRAMLENARQGFWNGSRPPFGYRTEIAERRGSKDKKVLVVDEGEARTVRMIFALATGDHGKPLGVKAIASHLNERGVLRRGRRFTTGGVYDILTTSTYHGLHHFNCRDSRTGRPRPPSEWVPLVVPPIIDERTFNTAGALLKSRNPRRIPPRIVNGPTLLAGIARCGHCGAALIQNTGKGGRYRYYCCSRKLKEGRQSCVGLRMPMGRLDELVLQQIARRILDPRHLKALLAEYLKSARDREGRDRARLADLRRDHGEAKAAIARLLDLVEKGLVETGDADFRERFVAQQHRRDELADEITALHRRMSSAEPIITVAKLDKLAALLRERLLHGSPNLRQAYANLILDDVRVDDREIRISGSKAALAGYAARHDEAVAPEVLSFVRKWRTRQDSNL